MKELECLNCGKRILIDTTPESDNEKKNIQSKEDYNNDMLCTRCNKLRKEDK